jgi:glutathione S-transferase
MFDWFVPGTEMTLFLYDMSNASGVAASPYGFRIHGALRLLSLPYETELLGYAQVVQKFSETHKTVPVLVDGDREIGDSWAIATHLAENHDPDNLLFGGVQGYPLVCFITRWVDASIMGAVNRVIVKEIHDSFHPKDQARYRSKEEARFGQSLESLHLTRDAGLPDFQVSLHPARQAVKEHPFLGGDSPTYADFSLHSVFRWARLVSEIELLRPDDRLQKWIGRMDDWLENDTGPVVP